LKTPPKKRDEDDDDEDHVDGDSDLEEEVYGEVVDTKEKKKRDRMQDDSEMDHDVQGK
jgi:cell division control protein 45